MMRRCRLFQSDDGDREAGQLDEVAGLVLNGRAGIAGALIDPGKARVEGFRDADGDISMRLVHQQDFSISAGGHKALRIDMI